MTSYSLENDISQRIYQRIYNSCSIYTAATLAVFSRSYEAKLRASIPADLKAKNYDGHYKHYPDVIAEMFEDSTQVRTHTFACSI